MDYTENDPIPLHTQQDIVLVRQHVRKLTQQLGMSLVDQTKMVTAASELARNAVIHGGGGEVYWRLLAQDGKKGVEVKFVDHGAGIANLEVAMMDGWSSGTGLGMGLSGAKRLVNDFSIESEVGNGTSVTIARWC